MPAAARVGSGQPTATMKFTGGRREYLESA